jgi:hypothetical protein
MARSLSLPAFCILAAIRFGGSAELLHFDFNDTAHFGIQAGSLPAGTVIGPIQASEAAGSADFRGGVVKLPDFPGPQGPFSIEARFRIRSYGPEDSRFVSDILNTGTWNSDPPETDGTPTQGFVFRVGGGYLYPVLPENRYASSAEWAEAQRAWSNIDRGRLSVCFADFVIARRDDPANWKEAPSDGCVQLGAWTHMAAVWDGTDMHLYLNGVEATDSLRLQGVGHPPRIDSVETAFVGGRKDRSWDPRRFDGDIDFVRMEDRALTPAEIHARYKDTFVPERRDSLCMGVAVPDYPEAGRVCQGRIKMVIKIANHGACTDARFIAGFLSGDSVEIELSKNPSFDPIEVRARFAMLSFELGADELGSLATYNGPIYWRVRLVPAVPKGTAAKLASAKTLLAKKAAADTGATAPEWSPSRPLILDMAATALSRPQPRLVRAEKGLLLTGLTEPSLYDLAGHRMPARFRRLPDDAGTWRLEGMPAAAGILLAR